jgi:hypothetical protein
MSATDPSAPTSPATSPPATPTPDPAALPSAPDAAAAAPAQPAPPVRPSRWLDRLSATLLFAAAAVATIAAAPALLRAAGAPLPEARAPEAAPQPLDLRHAPPEILANPDKLFDPDHDLEPDDLPGSAPFAAAHGKLGRVLGLLTLRDRPADGGKLVGEAKAGELVMVVKEVGDWAFVWAQIDDTMVVGWAKKSGIAVR